MLKHLSDIHPEPFVREYGVLGNYAMAAIANTLTRYGLVDRGRESSWVWRITELGRLHLEYEDLPLMELPRQKMYW